MFVAKPITYEIDANGCHVCNSHKPNSNGYPVKRHKGKFIHLHRYIYLTQIGTIPEGIVVRHKCDNPLCINPEHFELGTQIDNIQDMVDRRRNASNIGEKNPRAILKESDVIKILSLFKNGMRYGDIAKQYKVEVSTVKKIVYGKNWKHLQEGDI